MSHSKGGSTQNQYAGNEEFEDSPESGISSRKKSPRPAQCRNFARDAVAESMPDIVKSFVEKAKDGSVPHFNLLTKLGGFDQRPASPPSKRRGKSFARRLLDDMKQHEAKLNAASKERSAALRIASEGKPAS